MRNTEIKNLHKECKLLFLENVSPTLAPGSALRKINALPIGDTSRPIASHSISHPFILVFTCLGNMTVFGVCIPLNQKFQYGIYKKDNSFF